MPDYDLYDPPALVRGKWRVDKAPNRIPCDEQSRSAIPLNIRLVTPPSSAISTTTGSSMTARRARAHTTTLGRTLSSGGYNNLNSTLSAPAFSPHSTPQPGGNLITISQSTPSYPTGSGSTRQQQGIFAKTMSSGTPSASESLRLATPRDSVVTATRPPSSENGAAKGPAVGRSAATKGKVDAVSVPPSALKKPSTPLTSSRGESSTPTPRGASATPLLTSQASSPKSATATTLMSTNTVAALTQSAAAATANGTGGAAAGQTQRSRPPSSRPETAKQRAARAKKEQEVALAEVRRVEKEEESALPPDADVESHRQLRERLRREKLSKDSLSLVSQSVSKALSNAQITSKPFVVDGSKGLVLNVMTLPESLAGKQGGRQAQKEANAAANNSPNGSVDMQTPRRANRGASPQQTDHGEEELARLIMDPQYANSSDGVVLKCATPRYSISKEESKGTEVAAPSSVSKKLAFQPRRPSAEGQGPANSSHPSARRGNKTAESQRQAEFIVPENMPHMLIDVVPSGGVAHTELTPRPLAMRQQMEQKFGEGSGGGAVSTTVAVTASGAPVSSAASIGVRRQAEMVFPPGKMNREEYMRLVAATTTGNQTAKRDGEGFFDVPVPPKTTVPKVPTPPAATTTSATTTTKVTPPTAAASAAAPSTFNLDFSRFSPSSSVNVVGGLATPLTITGRGQGISGGPSRAARSTHSAGAAPAASSARKPSVTSSTVFSKVAASPNPAASMSMDSVHSARSAPRSVQFNLESNGVTVYDAGALLDNGDDYQED
eukprot:GILI01009374.1.p1 GENE.GILI01009374.1~~GILI01009374.1.p1  ORF type:complete len:854 (-),score=164.28 GILI01009374.1:166-2502(-)